MREIKKRLIKLFRGGSETIEQLRKRGVIVGNNVSNYGRIDGGHGHLVEIGDDVIISDALILSHDASTKIWLDKSKIGRVKVGNRVFIGAGVIILPNVVIGDDVIIGAGSVVTKNVSSNSVVAGNPAKKICSLEDYIEKNREIMKKSPIYETYWKNKTKDEINRQYEELKDGGWGYDV